ncbi:hypothetical protein L9F63_024094, partial [Diploptera punctata]
ISFCRVAAASMLHAVPKSLCPLPLSHKLQGRDLSGVGRLDLGAPVAEWPAPGCGTFIASIAWLTTCTTAVVLSLFFLTCSCHLFWLDIEDLLETVQLKQMPLPGCLYIVSK